MNSLGRLSVRVSVFAATLLLMGADAGAAKLLRLDGHHAKWGEAVVGTGATITVAILEERNDDPAARNCKRMDSLARLADDATGLTKSTISSEIAAALAIWEMAANVVFKRTADIRRADILIGVDADSLGRAFANVRLEDRSPAGAISGSEKAFGLGAPRKAEVPPFRARWRGREVMATIARSRVCLSARQQWKIGFDGDESAYDLRYVFAHELGHAIGLDHSGAEDGLMGYRYREGSHALSQNDVAAVQELYGPPRTGRSDNDFGAGPLP